MSHPLKGRYFFIVYEIHPYMCSNSYHHTICIDIPPEEYLKKVMKDDYAEISRNSYNLIDYVEITKDEYKKWKHIQEINAKLNKEDEEKKE